MRHNRQQGRQQPIISIIVQVTLSKSNKTQYFIYEIKPIQSTLRYLISQHTNPPTIVPSTNHHSALRNTLSPRQSPQSPLGIHQPTCRTAPMSCQNYQIPKKSIICNRAFPLFRNVAIQYHQIMLTQLNKISTPYSSPYEQRSYPAEQEDPQSLDDKDTSFDDRFYSYQPLFLEQYLQYFCSLPLPLIACHSQLKQQFTALQTYQDQSTIQISTIVSALKEDMRAQLEYPPLARISANSEVYRNVLEKQNLAGMRTAIFETAYQVKDVNGRQTIKLVGFGCNQMESFCQWAKEHSYKSTQHWIDAARRVPMLTAFTQIVQFFSRLFDATEHAFEQLAKSLSRKEQHLQYDCFRNYARRWRESVYPFGLGKAASKSTLSTPQFLQLKVVCSYLHNLSIVADRLPDDLINNHVLSLHSGERLLFYLNQFSGRMAFLQKQRPNKRWHQKQLMKELVQFMRAKKLSKEILFNQSRISSILKSKMLEITISCSEKQERAVDAFMKMVQLWLAMVRGDCMVSDWRVSVKNQ